MTSFVFLYCALQSMQGLTLELKCEKGNLEGIIEVVISREWFGSEDADERVHH